MAGHYQNIIRYQIQEEREEIRGSEHRKNRHYTRVLHSTLHLDEMTGALSQGGTSIDEVAIDCWSGGETTKEQSRTVSTLIGGPVENSVRYTSDFLRDNHPEATGEIFELDREMASFQFSRTDLWDITFQDSGWLDIFTNSSTTELFK